MKILKNTLKSLIEPWDDPGDYPNAVASGPLPSYRFLAGVEGEVVIELTGEEVQEYRDCPEDFLGDLDIRRPDGVLSWKLVVDKAEGNVLTLSVEDVEPDPDYPPPFEREFDPVDEWERRALREV